MNQSLPAARTFAAPDGSAGTGIINIVIACILFAVAPCAFCAIVRLPGDHMMLIQMTTTLPILLGIGMLMSGLNQRKAPKSLTIGPEGIALLSQSGQAIHYPWGQIGWLKKEQQAMQTAPSLHIFDASGKTIITLPHSFPELPAIIALIESHLARKTDNTAQAVIAKKSRKQGFTLLLCSLFFLVVGVGSGFLAWHMHRENKEFTAFAVPGIATITETFTAPDGVTRRINIKIEGENGKTGTNNIEIEPALWKTMKAGDPFPVNYVPQNPDNNQPLLTGLPTQTQENPLIMVIASAFGMIGFAVCVLTAVMSFKGCEIEFDSRTLFKIKKQGMPVSQSPQTP